MASDQAKPQREHQRHLGARSWAHMSYGACTWAWRINGDLPLFVEEMDHPCWSCSRRGDWRPRRRAFGLPLVCMSHCFGSVESRLTGPVKPLAGSALVRAISFECFSAETIRRNVIAWAPLGGQLQERVGSCEGARDGFHISHSVSPSVRQSVLGLFSFTEAEFCMEP